MVVVWLKFHVMMQAIDCEVDVVKSSGVVQTGNPNPANCFLLPFLE